MKKIFMWFLMIMFATSMIFTGIACKTDVVVEDETAEVTEETTEEEVAVEEETEEEVVEEEIIEEPKEVVFVTCLLEVYPGWNKAHAAFLAKAEELGYIGTVVGPNEINIEKQLELIETAIANNVDAIITCPLYPESFLPVYEKALEAEILIGESAVPTGSELPNVITTALTDNVNHGKLAAEKIAEHSGGEAKVLIASTGPDAGNQVIAIDSFLAETEQNYPGVVVVEQIFTDSDLVKGIEGMKNALTGYPEINYIWGTEGFIATGGSTALAELEREGEVHILGMDLAADTAELIKEGKVWACFDQNFDGWGAAPLEQIHNYWTGQPVERIVDTGLFFYDASNIDDFVPYE